MFEVVEKFTSYFKWDVIDLDNWVWKLYSKASVALCMLAAALCICSAYFGNPIDCYGTDDKFITQYCWVHGSYHFAIEQKALVQEIHDRTGQNCLPPEYYDDKMHERPTTEYYQWVIFMLFAHGILFLLPDYLWKFLEGGLVENFVPLNKEDPKLSAKKFDGLSKSQNRVYFCSFLGCEVLNFFVGIANFCIMDWFLKGKFATYGTEVVTYFMSGETTFNPMCSVFPTLVSCEYYTGGVGVGTMDIKNHICMLSQNIINEKIYLILWFWILMLFGASMIMLLYRLGTILVPSVREYELLYRARKGESKKIRSLMKKDLNLSQWFILSQIGRNSKSREFNEFLHQVEKQIGTSSSGVVDRSNNVELQKMRTTSLDQFDEPLIENGDVKVRMDV